MNYVSFVSIITAFISFSIGLYIHLKDPDDKINQLYFLLMLLLSFLSFIAFEFFKSETLITAN